MNDVTARDDSYRANHDRLSIGELDYTCQGFGIRCLLCGNRIPEGGGVCPSIDDTELVHEIARKLHTGTGRGESGGE